jgi:hypothetical protein
MATMPTPSKRPQRERARRDLRSDAIVEDSSPSRPNKRRKKVSELRMQLPLLVPVSTRTAHASSAVLLLHSFFKQDQDAPR